MVPSINLSTVASRLVEPWAEKLSAALPDTLEGIYLTGSLLLNDFHLSKSDIDFVVICKELPSDQSVAKLRRLHQTLERNYQGPRLSGVYIPREVLRNDAPQASWVLSYDEGRIRYETFEMATVTLFELKSHACTIYGQRADTLPIITSLEDLHHFNYVNINTYWKRWCSRKSLLSKETALLLMFPRLTEWVLLGIARLLFVLQTGTMTSKTAAGNHCLDQLPDQFHPIIRDALAIRNNERTYPILGSYAFRPSLNRYRQTIACARYMIELFNTLYAERSTEFAR